MISNGEIRIKLKDEQLISAILSLIFGIIRYMYYPATQGIHACKFARDCLVHVQG